jgi:aspartyl-tRNA(Asn)/glutamyl-tRNA(Gln) amidotransferase subunit A
MISVHERHRAAGGDGANQSSLAGAERFLECIAAWDPILHAFITITPEAALASAREADALAARGHSSGFLQGLPLAVKDCIDVGGVRCTHGSVFFADHVPTQDAAVVRKLKSAGAVLLGKTNLHEFAFGGTSQNAFYGNCRNPWDTRRIPGGSSGGSAVAVAAGLAVGTLGTDTGSSIRMPAALCGVSGLRPTHGMVSAEGVFPVSPPLDTVGPIARDAAGLARIQAAIADVEASAAHGIAPNDFLDNLEASIEGLRIAVPDDFFFSEADPDVAEAALTAARVLERLGARLVTASIPGAAEVQSHQMPALIADAANLHRARLASAPEKFSEGVRRRLLPGLDMTATDYAQSLRWLEEWRRMAASFFQESADIMLTPTVPMTAPLADDDRNMAEVTRRLSLFCWTWPAAGSPALTVPCGFAGGLPIGMQFAAARWRDARLLNVGHRYQQATDWHLREPPLSQASAA